LLEADAVRLNAPYLKLLQIGRPWIIAKWAMTLDGKTAVGQGDSRWISSPASRALVHEVRGRMDAIVVGVGTAVADDPRLTARPPGPRTPLRVVLDGRARLPLTSNLVQTARETPTLVAVTDLAPDERRAALEDHGCEVVAFEAAAHVPIVPLLELLAGRGSTNVLVEGGGLVLGAFLDAGEVDEVDAFIAPILEGGDHARTAARGRGRRLMSDALRLDHVVHSSVDGDLRIRGVAPRPWRALAASLIGDGTANPP
jgi:diaminohydroxyphosphoribosylaminopyrimidine deaminase/5-amino-6-(5-phosphoribosylamino)uracil reductase